MRVSEIRVNQIRVNQGLGVLVFLLIRLQKITENSHAAIFGFKSCFFAEFTLLTVMWFLEIRKIILERRFNFQVPNKQFSLI